MSPKSMVSLLLVQDLLAASRVRVLMPLGGLSCLTALRILAPAGHFFDEEDLIDMAFHRMQSGASSCSSSLTDDEDGEEKEGEEEEREEECNLNSSKVPTVPEPMDIDSGGPVTAGSSAHNPTMGPLLQSADPVRMNREPELHLHFLASVSSRPLFPEHHPPSPPK